MNILIYTKKDNVKGIFNDIRFNMLFDNGILTKNKKAYILGSNGLEIRIYKYEDLDFNKQKARVILYDGEFSEQELGEMKSGLVDRRYEVIVENAPSETLLAPIELLNWLIVEKDFTYVVTSKNNNDKDIKLITKSLIQAINNVFKVKGNISCYKTNVYGSYDLWNYDLCEDDAYGEERMIYNIANSKLKNN